MKDFRMIEDGNDPVLDVYARLSEKQLLHYYEPEPGIFMAESPNVIIRGLEAGFEPLSLLTSGKLWNELPEALRARLEAFEDLQVYLASDNVLEQMPGFQITRGVQSIMRRKPLPESAEVVSTARRIVVLENVVNPTNVGAIFRSAAALHIDAVLLTSGCADPLQKRALRVSVGNVFNVPWSYIDSPLPLCEYLRTLGFATVSMALREDAIPLDAPVLKALPRMAILMGTEGEGLLASTIESSDYKVIIPMSNGVDSLNVAAASAVAFWELTK